MKGTQMIALNKKCWDTVAPYFFQGLFTEIWPIYSV